MPAAGDGGMDGEIYVRGLIADWSREHPAAGDDLMASAFLLSNTVTGAVGALRAVGLLDGASVEALFQELHGAFKHAGVVELAAGE